MELGHPSPRVRENHWWLWPPWSWDHGIQEWPGLEGTSQGAQLGVFSFQAPSQHSIPQDLPCQSPGHRNSSLSPTEIPQALMRPRGCSSLGPGVGGGEGSPRVRGTVGMWHFGVHRDQGVPESLSHPSLCWVPGEMDPSECPTL